jgi:hypothetical protein
MRSQISQMTPHAQVVSVGPAEPGGSRCQPKGLRKDLP